MTGSAGNLVDIHPDADKEARALQRSNGTAMDAIGRMLVVCYDLRDNGVSKRPALERKGFRVHNNIVLRVFRSRGYLMIYARLEDNHFAVLHFGPECNPHQWDLVVKEAIARLDYW